jgi:hypothetical protein
MYDGALLYEELTDSYLRVLRAEPLRVLFMPMDGKGWPFSRSRQVAKRNEDLGVWRLVPQAATAEAPDGTIEVGHASPKAHQFGDATYQRFFAETDLAEFVTRAGRSKVLRRLQQKDKGLAASTFYRHLRRFLEGGLTINSLNGRWRGGRKPVNREDLEEIAFNDAKEACRALALKLQALGAPKPPSPIEFSTTKSDTLRKRSPPKAPTHYQVDRNTLRVFLHYYKKKTREALKSLRSLYDDIRDEVFATPNPYGRPDRWPLWCIPSLKNFKAYWRQLIPREDRTRAEKGDHAYDTNLRPLAQAISLAFVAGRVGELDATIWPVMLRGDEPGAPEIGPPVVFRIRCRDCSMLFGLSVSLESAGWIGAGMAIANCMEDKEAYCAKLGVLDVYRRLPWVAMGLPAEILADQGETYNNKPRAFIRLTGTSISHPPGARPDLKGGVESDWEVLQIKLEEVTPGAIVRRFEEECGEKWHMKGNMTLTEFTQMLVIMELKRMYTPRQDKILLPELVRKGVDSSPHSLFHWSITNAGGGLKQVDVKLARLSLLPRRKGSITEWGITVRNFHFSCVRTVMDEAHARARAQGRTTVDVAWDPLLINNVWLIVGDPDAPEAYVKCSLDMRFRHQAGYLGKTWREVERILYDGAVTENKRLEDLDKDLAYADDRHKQIAANGQQVTQAQREAVPKSQNELRRGMAAAREVAKDRTSPPLAISAPLDEPRPARANERPPLYVVKETNPSEPQGEAEKRAASSPAAGLAEPTPRPARRDFFAEALEEAAREQQDDNG